MINNLDDFEYIGAPGGVEANTWEVDAGVFGTIMGMYSTNPYSPCSEPLPPPTVLCGGDNKEEVKDESLFTDEFDKSILDERNSTMAFGVGSSVGNQNNKCESKEKPSILEIDTGMYGTIKCIEYPIRESNELSNININRGQLDMFSFNNQVSTPINGVDKNSKKETYRPLPDSLTIKKSSIDGLGLFATKHIYLSDVRDHYKWMTHTLLVYSEDNTYKVDELLRTAIGSFINHSNNPNCTLGMAPGITTDEFIIGRYYLQPLRDIEADEEITLNYNKELCGLIDYDGAEFLKDK